LDRPRHRTGTRWNELAAAGLITATEARQIARHDALLQTLRTRLHYLAKRREDRLLFDFQPSWPGRWA